MALYLPFSLNDVLGFVHGLASLSKDGEPDPDGDTHESLKRWADDECHAQLMSEIDTARSHVANFGEVLPAVRQLNEDDAVHVLSDQDHATIIAALRYYQQHGQGDPENRSDEIHELATNGGYVTSMDADGIDALCLQLNTP